MPLDFDTIVIGAGIVGSSCAYKIAQSARRTLLLEQFSLGHVHGSSHGASRIIRCTHSDPTFLPFALDAYNEWELLQQKVVENERGGEGAAKENVQQQQQLVIKNGLLTLDVEMAQTERRAHILHQWGRRHEILRGGAAIQRRFPHLVGYGEQWSAVYEPDGGTMLAENCLKTVQAQFLAQGGNAQLNANEPVLNILPKMEAQQPEHSPASFVEVQTSKGKYRAENVVVAVGGWLSQLVPDLPLQAKPSVIGVYFWRVQSRPELFRPLAADVGGSPNLVISDELGQELFALPAIDYPNAVKFAIHLPMPISKMNEMGEFRAPEWMHAIPAAHIAKHLPDLDSTDPMHKCTCIYTMTDDVNFIVDQHPSQRNIFIAGGFSGTGFKFALTIGKVMAKWVSGEQGPPELDMRPFRLDRNIDVRQKARL